MSSKRSKKNKGKLTEDNKNYEGVDFKGSKYSSIEEMWKVELENQPATGPVFNKVGDRETWFSKGNQYWTGCEASNNGVLGGYGNLSDPDIKFSLKFMIDVFRTHPLMKRESALDCGAGIGRITKDLLTKMYKTIDVSDQCEKYIEAAKTNLVAYKNVRKFYAVGMQSFQFEEKYDCVWVQWALCYLPDKEAVEFLVRAKDSLNPHGLIILKENQAKTGFVVDKDDYSVVRTEKLYKKLIQEAGLIVIKEEFQADWPEDLFDVKMYALQPPNPAVNVEPIAKEEKVLMEETKNETEVPKPSGAESAPQTSGL